jgi:hypothetical protein
LLQVQTFSAGGPRELVPDATLAQMAQKSVRTIETNPRSTLRGHLQKWKLEVAEAASWYAEDAEERRRALKLMFQERE